METSTLVQHYRDPKVFHQELESIFERTWQFVGFTFQAPNHHDFITRTIGTKPIVIQNFHGRLSAFLNVCTHRFSQIHDISVECGTRPLRCPYHGWTFDEQGCPIGVPRKSDFPCLPASELGLTRYAVESCGAMLFVRLSPEGPTLREYLKDLYPVVENVSSGMDCCVDRYERTIKANWKLLVENSLEGYHVAFVHANSIGKFGISSTYHGGSNEGELVLDFHSSDLHSWIIDAVGENTMNDWGKIEGHFQTRPFKSKTYHQHQIFPNTNLATMFGSSFHVQSFMPLSHDETRIVHYTIRTKLNSDSKKDKAVVLFATENMIKLGKQILDEDLQICEQVQRGIEHAPATRRGILSTLEARVRHYQDGYMKMLTYSG